MGYEDQLRHPRTLGVGGRVWLLNTGIAAAALVLYFTWTRHLPGLASSVAIPWWVVAAIFFVAEFYVIRLEFRRDAHSFSLSELPLVIGLFFLSPGELMVAQFIGGAAALARRRQQPVKLAFNLSNDCLNIVVASAIFHAIVPRDDPLAPSGWLAAFMAALVTGLMGPALINLAIYLSGDEQTKLAWSRVLWIAAAVTATTTSFALISVTVLWFYWQAVGLLLAPLLATVFLARAYASERQRQDSLEFLYESTRMVQRSPLEVDQVVRVLLEQAREMFRAEIAEITMFASKENESSSCTTLGPGDRFEEFKPVDLNPREGVWARIASEGQALLLPRPIANERLRQFFVARNIKDAMFVPLRGKTGVVGMLMTANRLGDVATFDAEDLKLCETLANHASVSLENASLIHRLEESLARLTELNRMKDDLVASVSHELRSPLTCIQGYIKTLLRPGVTFTRAQQHSFLEEVDGASNRLRRLIEDLLVLSRFESRRDWLVLSTVSVPAVVNRIRAEILGPRTSHSVELRFDGAIPLIQTDEGKLQQILVNLIENAFKYSPEGSSVIVRGHCEDRSVTISVEDQGCGIPPDLQEKIFDRFYQVDQSSTRTAGGTGLGLYICRKLAEMIGGAVWLERSTQSGSVFCVRMPHAVSRDSRPDLPEAKARVIAEGPSRSVVGS